MAYTFLFMDYESRSLADLSEVGTDNYMKDPSTEILMLSWALDHEDINLWQPRLGPPPQKLVGAMKDASILKVAWSSQFEYNATKRKFGTYINEPAFMIPLEQWRDGIVLAHNLSLPGKLEKVGEILKMEQQKLNHERAGELKKMFCNPVSRGGEMTLFGIAPPLFRDWNSQPREWEEFCQYCIQDTRTERDLWYRLIKIPFPERDWQGWLLDQKINEFGMPGTRELGEKALRIALRYQKEQKINLAQMTGLKNPNSDQQFKAWLAPRGYSWNSVRANYVQAELDNPESKLTPEAREACILRRETKKSSYKKIERFLAVLSKDDDRLRNQFKYMAAARTGRWAGGDVQVQNLPRGEKAVKKNLGRALELLAAEDYDTIKREFYDDVKDPKKRVSPVAFVTTLLRSLFQAKQGKKIVVADLNAIENRVLGWVAGCKDILDVFRTCNNCGHLCETVSVPFFCPQCGCQKARCPYISFGTRMYKKPYAEMWAAYAAGNEEDRQNSKPAVLGAGYGLGGGEMFKNENGDMVRGGLWGYAKSVCGVDMPKELAHESVQIFRDSYPEVVQLWTDLEEAFKQVLARGGKICVGEVTWDSKQKQWVKHPTMRPESSFANGNHCVLEFQRNKIDGGGYLMRIVLPSGRALHYLNATIDKEERTSKRTGNKYTVDILRYDGIEHSANADASGQSIKKKHKWGRTKTYGGKICENVVQAISRDILLNGMILANEMGFCIFGLFHDELANEVDDVFDGLTVRDLVWCMAQVPSWAPGLILGAEGFEGPYYKKS
jgi:DNA polymerase bacteriophage-type